MISTMELLVTLAKLTDTQMLQIILAAVFYVGGFVLAPILAKRFAGALGNLTGMVNDRSRGFVDRRREKLRGFSRDAVDNRSKRRKVNRAIRMETGEGNMFDRMSTATGEAAARKRAGGTWRKNPGATRRRVRDSRASQWTTEKIDSAAQRVVSSRTPIASRAAETMTAGGRGERRDKRDQADRAINTAWQNQKQEELQPIYRSLHNDQLLDVLDGQEFDSHQKQAAITEFSRRKNADVLRGYINNAQRLHASGTPDVAFTQALARARQHDNWISNIEEVAPDIAHLQVDVAGNIHKDVSHLETGGVGKANKWSLGTWNDALDASGRAAFENARKNAPIVLGVPALNPSSDVMQMLRDRGFTPSKDDNSSNANPES